MATEIAWALWRGMSPDYKRRYARVIWDQFQSRLQGEAMATSSLGTFVNSACSKLGVVSLGRRDDLGTLDGILNSGQDRLVLRLLREETALIVVKVRLMNEERRAEIEALMDDYAQEDALREAQEGGALDGLSD